MSEQSRDDETPKERADRELIELLNELRVVLPGVTVLLAFLLAVPFANGWTRVTSFQRDVFVVAFLSTAVAVALLTAPSSYHRLRFRHGDKERIVRIRSDRELIELLNELRVVLPGVTVLLAFLLAVPFANGWTRVTSFQRDVFVVAFLSTAVAVALLTAPSSYHRLRFRHGDKERIVRI